MIVCVCNNISERTLVRAVDAGATSMADLRSNLGVGNCCGKCNACAKSILREHLQPSPSSMPVPLAA